ncbi:hypothetical protein CPC08DRAFT_637960 [Agrocybe pediades]|nr:hypothetical protein CPC08DRAFT_637960 [Agrocybe pediades]
MASATSSPRWVMVDDTSPDYQYTGPWFQARGNQDDIGNFGPPFQSTLHGINANGTIKYTYHGSKVVVYGTSVVQMTAAGTDPDWSCSVDGADITKLQANLFPENNFIICSGDSLSDGPHTITINAIVRQQTTFWFDRIQYIPSASVDLSNATVLVDALDSAVTLSSGWMDMGGIGNMTQQNGAKLTLDFIGSSLSWVSLIPSDQPRGSSSATYAIDGGTPTSFFLSGLQPTEMAQYNKIFFQTPQLSPSQHRLEVVYDGNSGVTPLTIDYFVVQNSTVPSTSTSSSATSQASNPNTSASNAVVTVVPVNSKKTPVGAIAGGVVGGILLVAIIAVLLLMFRRRQKKLREKAAYDEVDLAAGPIEPFTDPPSLGASYHTGTTTTQNRQPKFAPVRMPNAETIMVQQHSSGPSSSSLVSGPSSSYMPSSTGTASRTGMGSASTPSNSSSNLLMSSKEREAQGLAGASTARNEVVPPNAASGSAGRVLRHEDSGIRLPPQEEEPLVELPPLYTPG